MIPSLDFVQSYQGDETHISITLDILADLETPISLYLKLSDGEPNTFLLESAEGGEVFGRYSFVGVGSQARLEFSNGSGTLHERDRATSITFTDPLDVIEERLATYRIAPRAGLPRFQGGAVGYLSYDCVRYFESIPLPERDPLDIPEGIWLFCEDLVIYDHLKHRITLLTHMPLAGDRARSYREACERLQNLYDRLCQAPAIRQRPHPWPESIESDLPIERNMTREAFEQSVRDAKEAISAGEVFQVVFSQRQTVQAALPPFEVYRSLRALNPSPYLFYFNFGDWSIVGASPEVLVRVEQDDILLRPIAGTRPRGSTPEADEALAADLLHDEKELAEHRMLLDLGRNDVGRVASPGSVKVGNPLHIERYSHVMHIVSDVHGCLRAGQTAFDVLRSCFPAGTVSGAPKIRAMELISAHEPDRRSLYAGTVGYFDFSGNMDTCIAIRTIVVQGDKLHVQTGAGLVYDSDPAKEYEECLNKAKSCLSAIALTASREPQ